MPPIVKDITGETKVATTLTVVLALMAAAFTLGSHWNAILLRVGAIEVKTKANEDGLRSVIEITRDQGKAMEYMLLRLQRVEERQ